MMYGFRCSNLIVIQIVGFHLIRNSYAEQLIVNMCFIQTLIMLRCTKYMSRVLTKNEEIPSHFFSSLGPTLLAGLISFFLIDFALKENIYVWARLYWILIIKKTLIIHY